MDREKEKIVEYVIIAGIGVALFVAVLAFNDAHAQLRIPQGLKSLEGIRHFTGLDGNSKPAPVPAADRCHNLGDCGSHYTGGVRG